MLSMKDTSDKSDPKDARMDHVAALPYMYAEFAQEDRQLAETGLEYYARTLEEDEARS